VDRAIVPIGDLELLDPLFEIVLMQLSKAFSILIGKVV